MAPDSTKSNTPHAAFRGVRGFLSPLTRPAAAVWHAGARVRARRKPGLLAPVPVVSVGNLQVGGTGKTPTVQLVVELLRAMGHNPLVLSRGYKARFAGPVKVPPHGNAVDYGDEPLMLARGGLDVCVARDRSAGAVWASQHGDWDVLVLDDGFSQRAVAVDLQIVLWDVARPGSEHCLPYGNLRGPLALLAEADLLVLRGADDIGAAALPAAADDVEKITLVYERGVLRGPEPKTDLRVVVAAGVGNPAGVVASLPEACALAGTAALPDHARWHTDTVQTVQRLVDRTQANAVVITCKDEVKRTDWDALFSVPVFVLEAALKGQSQSDIATLQNQLEQLWAAP